jgi:fructuronate reductase
MTLNLENLKHEAFWSGANVALPRYDVAEMVAKTKAAPCWVHFGAGNIFRVFIAALQQRLLNGGLADRGITVAETFDYEIIEKIYHQNDNLTLSVILNADATTTREAIASVAEALRADSDMERLAEVFGAESLQMASFTITEKGYAVTEAQTRQAPGETKHAMGILAALLHKRYRAGAWPVACVSMDNCSHNGEKLKAGVLAFAEAWQKEGHVEAGFIGYLNDTAKVSFPWSMIDKITPRPAEKVRAMLEQDGIEGMETVITDKGTYTAAFVNAERPQYLVVEDSFPNGRPPLEKAGVHLTGRETVNRVERMKVTTCLNPLHTAMSVFGCLLGYTLIADEMKDEDIVWLVKRLGYVEGLPVVTDPGIIAPKEFIDEVVNERLPNPFMPDDPRRIATDTSQKVGIRFGETVKGYIENGLDLNGLVALPLAIAGWFRYLLGDEVSPDPRREELQQKLRAGRQREILADESIFGLDLTKTVLGEKIEAMLAELCAGPEAVREVLHKYAGM